jgi:hypothetical protein
LQTFNAYLYYKYLTGLRKAGRGGPAKEKGTGV